MSPALAGVSFTAEPPGKPQITTPDNIYLEKAWDDIQENRTWSRENFVTFTAALLQTMKIRNNLKNIHKQWMQNKIYYLNTQNSV